MLCIAAFILFLILFPVGMFFPSYRRLLAKSWHCVSRRIQLKPCDISFGEEVKQFIVGLFAFRVPWLAKFIMKTAEFWAWVFVLTSLWSIWSVAHSGLNLLVYDTCDPFTVEGCSLAGDSCEIGRQRAPIWEWRAYIQDQRDYYVETISRVPDVFRSWNSEEFLVETSTFSGNLESDQLVIEVMDPSCIYCRNVWINIQNSEGYERARISYLLYPIPYQSFEGYRFPNSYFLATIIESLKLGQQDFEFLDIYFVEYQDKFVTAGGEQAEYLVREILTDRLDMTTDEVDQVFERAASKEVEDSLIEQRKIVEDDIRTLKIPTVFVGTERFDRVIDSETITNSLR